MKDPRGHPRSSFSQAVLLWTNPKKSRLKGQATLVDMSYRGLGFETKAELRRGELVFLKIYLPVSLACEVRHIVAKGDAYRCGARVAKMRWLDKVSLKRFLKNQPAAVGSRIERN